MKEGMEMEMEMGIVIGIKAEIRSGGPDGW